MIVFLFWVAEAFAVGTAGAFSVSALGLGAGVTALGRGAAVGGAGGPITLILALAALNWLCGVLAPYQTPIFAGVVAVFVLALGTFVGIAVTASGVRQVPRYFAAAVQAFHP